jgi:flagellar biosynthesis protein FlhA
MLNARAQTSLSRFGFRAGNLADFAAAVGVIGILVIMVARVPPSLLDVLLALNLSFSLILLLVAFYISEPLEFSTFPSVLLLATIFRLALNISSTKLILGGAGSGEIANKAGNVINFFGSVVARSDAVVGLVIFIILVVVQFIVIVKGAGRIAEVAARFTLDAMPGKQMAIDADLNAGLITEAEARERRTKIAREADFYGAMDGASKFVRGDAIAGIIITLINLIGGFLVGRFRENLTDVGSIFQNYSLLTIGDGLVSQIPALLVATAAGIVVTRAATRESLGQKVSEQILGQPAALYVATGALALIGLFSLTTSSKGLFVPFAMISSGVGLLATRVRHTQEQKVEADRQAEMKARQKAAAPESVDRLLRVDPMEIEMGYALVPLVDAEQGGDLLERVTAIRRSTALEMGLVVPPIRIRDNMQLQPHEYSIKIRGVQVGKGELRVDRLLAISSGTPQETIPGIDTHEPAFGLPGKWIRKSDRDRAELSGHNVIEPAAVLATHLAEIIRLHAAEILGRQEVQSLIDAVKESNPVIVDELVPHLLTVGQIQKVLRNLLRERIPIRDLATIFETLADHAAETKDADILTECARAGLSRVITQRYIDENNTLSVITLEPKLEHTLTDAIQKTDRGQFLAVEPDAASRILQAIGKAYETALGSCREPVILTTPALRPQLRRLVERALPRIPVLSYAEIASEAAVKNAATVRLGSET